MHGGFGRNYEIADKHSYGYEQPAVRHFAESAAYQRTHRGKADVCTRQKEHKPCKCDDKSHADFYHLTLVEHSCKNLEQYEKYYYRRESDAYLLRVCAHSEEKLPERIIRVARCHARIVQSVFNARRAAYYAEYEHGDYGTHAGESHKTEGIVLALLIASYGGDAHAEGHYKGHSHGTRGYSARIERNRPETGIHKQKSKKKGYYIECYEQYGKAYFEHYPQHCNGEEYAYAHRHRDYKHPAVYGLRYVARKNLQIWFGNGDDYAYHKGDERNQPHLARMGDYRTYLFADYKHGHIRAHIKQRKPYDQHNRAEKKEHELERTHPEYYRKHQYYGGHGEY